MSVQCKRIALGLEDRSRGNTPRPGSNDRPRRSPRFAWPGGYCVARWPVRMRQSRHIGGP